MRNLQSLPEPERRPVRLVYVIDKLSRAGAQRHLHELASHLDRERVAPEICCLLQEGPLAGSLRAQGVRVDSLDLGRLYGPRAWAAFVRLARRLRRERTQIVHTYLTSANVFGTLAGRVSGVQAIVTSRRDMGFARNWRLRLVEEGLVNRLADRVVAVCPAVAAVTRRERGLDASNVVTIPNGVDCEAWDPARFPRDAARAALSLESDEPAVGIVASLTPVKGHAELLQAAARVLAQRRARFVLIGDGPLRGELERLADGLGIRQQVVFAGVQGDIARLMTGLDVVAITSHSEGLSNTLLEAMAMERCVVATAVGGNVDVLRDGETGRLVPPRDPEALASCLLSLLDSPPAARRLGEAARRSVVAEYPLSLMVARHEELYQSLVA
jgi:glycosyltransferase involved in cell wall biosynthesis